MKHTRALVELYQRAVPDTSQTLQSIAARCLVEIETAELQAARIAELEAYVSAAGDWFSNFCAHSPIRFGGEDDLGDMAHALLRKGKP